MSNIRVRFAPSPTGPLHMGGVRTALYNYLFARKHGGTFILRLEDTDQTRFVPGAEEYIVDALKWCGMEIDEGIGAPDNSGPHGPYRQSERKAMYRQYAMQLIENGNAYYAFDTPEELEEMRERMKQAGVPSPQYNAVTRAHMKNSTSLSAEEVQKRLDAGDPYVIRVKMPRNEEVRFEDQIRGWVVVNTANLDDKVLFKSDGMPTYHLANIVDDHLMEVTHVIRGEEWLPSAPLHVLLYRFFGWESPQFAHLPLILKPDGKGKLSKRDGDRLGFPVFPTNWVNPETQEVYGGYREWGYFPEAFVNMMAFLGWNPGTNQEIFSMEELIEAFSIDRVGKSGARFDPDKTRWFNQQYLRSKDARWLGEALQGEWAKQGVDLELEKAERIAALLAERAVFVADMVRDGAYFVAPPAAFDEGVVNKKWKQPAIDHLKAVANEWRGLEEFTASTCEESFKNYLAEHDLGFGALGPVLRLALSGVGMGPSIFELAEIIGREEALARIEKALSELGEG